MNIFRTQRPVNKYFQIIFLQVLQGQFILRFVGRLWGEIGDVETVSKKNQFTNKNFFEGLQGQKYGLFKNIFLRTLLWIFEVIFLNPKFNKI